MNNLTLYTNNVEELVYTDDNDDSVEKVVLIIRYWKKNDLNKLFTSNEICDIYELNNQTRQVFLEHQIKKVWCSVINQFILIWKNTI